jgi:transposase-like protein
MSKRGSREHFNAEFKRKAVRQLLTSGRNSPDNEEV